MLIALPIIALLISFAILFSLARPRYIPLGKSNAAKISIIIPARDEEENIANLLTSIRDQSTHPLEILVIDDQSTDRTAEVARKLGATVIAGKEMPAGWKGKTWACQQGAEAATGDWLLYLDADITLLEGSLEKLAALTAKKATHSICPYHKVRRPYEQLSAFFNTITLAGVDAFAATPSQQSTLFGQVLLIHRDHYQEAGGHEAVKEEILENFQLAQRLKAQDIDVHLYLGKGTVEMRMFPHGLAQLANSWKKGFLAGAAQSPKRALLTTSLWLSGGMILLVCFNLFGYGDSNFQTATLLCSLGHGLLSFFCFRLAGNFSILTALFFPIPLIFYQFLFFKAIFDQKKGVKTTWKGRTID
ncbi:glycosyltransferase [Akkermansiaceae bacterium]|jgi:4,4'-diaponeurosporenoate glycosyltransferase|nr:glycosyltransferase [Akkermansiaceae bacterium]